MSDISIILGEDHLITRQGIRRLLEDEKGFKIIGEGANGEEVVRLVTELKPDVVIMDIAMPKLNGIEATRQIKLTNPRTGVLILSAYDDDEYVFALLKAGAAGYLLKTVSGDELVRAVKAIHKGEPVLAPSIAKKVMNYFKLPDKVPVLEEDSTHLSERELDIIRLAAKGLTNKDIADRLHLSYRTIEGHLRDIFNKLGVGSRTEAVLYGLKKGWFTLEELV
ncbi:MAG TPA: response regulator transcription factor [Dehalococcoidales bacterium]|nr:response regulator transcription factor [Dehalococcoidales bacterium]